MVLCLGRWKQTLCGSWDSVAVENANCTVHFAEMGWDFGLWKERDNCVSMGWAVNGRIIGFAFLFGRDTLIHVIATIELLPGTRDAFLAEFAKVVPDVHAEEGCIEYGPAVDIASGSPAQPPLREDVVTVVEKWSSVETLTAHSVSPHMQALRPRIKPYMVKTTLHVLSPV